MRVHDSRIFLTEEVFLDRGLSSWLEDDHLGQKTIFAMETTTESDMDYTLFNTSDTFPDNSTEYVEENYVKEIFVIFEFVAVVLELVISVVAAAKIPRWTRNHRNQMLMQLVVTNLMRCSVQVLSFYYKKYYPEPNTLYGALISCLKFYIDVVIIITFCFFVKHMYETLILVIVKINQKKVNTIFWITWLVPVPIALTAAAVVKAGYVKAWTMRLVICGAFKWPLMLLGTVLYVVILYRVLTEKIRVFARNLTVMTFLLCFLINFYILFKDVISLWCFKSLQTMIIRYTVGLTLNITALCVYTTYLIFCYRNLNTPTKKFASKECTLDLTET